MNKDKMQLKIIIEANNKNGLETIFLNTMCPLLSLFRINVFNE